MSNFEFNPYPDEMYHWGFGNFKKKAHKYIAKIGNRYFYTQQQLAAFKNKTARGVKNTVNQYKRALSSKDEARNVRSAKRMMNHTKRKVATMNAKKRVAWRRLSRTSKEYDKMRNSRFNKVLNKYANVNRPGVHTTLNKYYDAKKNLERTSGGLKAAKKSDSAARKRYEAAYKKYDEATSLKGKAKAVQQVFNKRHGKDIANAKKSLNNTKKYLSEYGSGVSTKNSAKSNAKAIANTAKKHTKQNINNIERDINKRVSSFRTDRNSDIRKDYKEYTKKKRKSKSAYVARKKKQGVKVLGY